MESVENPGEQRRGFASATTGFPPFPPSLGNRWRDSHIPTARRRRCSLTNLQTTNQGDTSTGLAEGTFLLGLDTRLPYPSRGPTAYNIAGFPNQEASNGIPQSECVIRGRADSLYRTPFPGREGMVVLASGRHGHERRGRRRTPARSSRGHANPRTRRQRHRCGCRGILHDQCRRTTPGRHRRGRLHPGLHRQRRGAPCISATSISRE